MAARRRSGLRLRSPVPDRRRPVTASEQPVEAGPELVTQAPVPLHRGIGQVVHVLRQEGFGQGRILLVKGQGLGIDRVVMLFTSSKSMIYNILLKDFSASFINPGMNTRLIGVEGVVPTFETIADGSYPLATEVYAVVRADAASDSPAVLLRGDERAVHYYDTLLAELEERLRGDRLPNVVRYDREVDAIDLPDDSVDMVLMVMTYHDLYYETEGWKMDPDAFFATVTYLLIYAFMNLGAFGVVIAIGNRLGVQVLSEPEIGCIQGYMHESTYDRGYADAPGFQGIRAQKTLNHRYIHEDVGYGLVFWHELGKQIGVETPNIAAVIQIASVLTGRDYLGEEKRTMESLGLSRHTAEELAQPLE